MFSKKVYVIAEAGTGHGGDLKRAYALVEAAAGAKVNAIKFQHVIADEIVPANVGIIDLPSGKVDIYEEFKLLEVPLDFLACVQKKCKELGIDFLCSAFGKKSAEDMRHLEVSAYKIASPEMNLYPLWNRYLASENTPIYFFYGCEKSEGY